MGANRWTHMGDIFIFLANERDLAGALRGPPCRAYVPPTPTAPAKMARTFGELFICGQISCLIWFGANVFDVFP